MSRAYWQDVSRRISNQLTPILKPPEIAATRVDALGPQPSSPLQSAIPSQIWMYWCLVKPGVKEDRIPPFEPSMGDYEALARPKGRGILAKESK